MGAGSATDGNTSKSPRQFMSGALAMANAASKEAIPPSPLSLFPPPVCWLAMETTARSGSACERVGTNQPLAAFSPDQQVKGNCRNGPAT